MNLGKETETLEFKKTTRELKEAMESIVAMLNKHGVGTLYFGVKPNGDVCGQDISESSLRDVSRTVYESIKPQIYPAIEEIILDGRHLIKVEFNGDDAPYSAYGKYYLRTADENREVTPTELKSFFVANEYKEKWEKSSSRATINQRDHMAIETFIKNAIQARRIPDGDYNELDVLNKFGLINGEYLNNAGEVLFATTNPVTLKTALFATDEKLTFLDMKLYEDNICNLLKEAEEYILKNIRWESEIIEGNRIETPEIPVTVIREILANSFAHAIYNENTNHEICIHPSFISVYNPGTYASSFKPEEYIRENRQSMIRNTLISKVLYLNKTIEQFGSGFKRIDSLCKDVGIKYSYEITEHGFTFKVYRKRISTNVIMEDKVNKTEQAILKLIKNNPTYTREQLAGKTSKTVRTVQRALNSLKEKGMIVRAGGNKDGHWEIKK